MRKMKSELEGAPEGVSRNVKGHMTGCEIKPKGTLWAARGSLSLKELYIWREAQQCGFMMNLIL